MPHENQFSVPAAPQERRPSAEGWLRAALLALIILAPLPFGCVEDWSRWVLITLLGALFCCFLWARIPIVLDRRARIALGLGCAYLLWLGLQMVPLPPAVLAGVSPAAHRLYRIAVPGYGDTDPRGYAYPDPEALAELKTRLETQPASASNLAEIPWITPSFSMWRSISLYPYGTYRVLCQTAAMIAFIIMGLSLFRERRHRRQLAYALVSIVAFEALYGIFETLTGHQHIFGYAKRYYTDVATGTLINRNHYAAMLNLILPLAVALALKPSRSHARPLRSLPPRLRLARILSSIGERRTWLLLAALMMGVAVFLSRSRMGIASMLAGLLACSLLMARWRRKQVPGSASSTQGPGSAWKAAVPLLLILVIAVYATAIGLSPTVDRFLRVPDDLEAGNFRPALWKETLPVIRDFAWTGAGAGAYAHALNPNLKTLPVQTFWNYDHAHNDYLEAVVTLGIIGALLGAAALVFFVLRLPHSLTALAALAGLLTLILHSLTDFLLAIPCNALMASGLICVAAARRDRLHSEAMKPPPLPQRRALHLTVMVATLAALLLWPGRSLLAAVTYRPYWNTSPDRPGVMGALKRASALESWNEFYPRLLAKSQAENSRQRAPRKLLLGANLKEQATQWQLGRLAEFASAHSHLLTSLELSPSDYELHFVLAQSASMIRRLVTSAGLGIPGSAQHRDALMSPHRASVALAPTAYGNKTAMGLLLWGERSSIGGLATSTALDFLHGSLENNPASRAWMGYLLQNSDDLATLVRIDQVLQPPATAYSWLIESASMRSSPELLLCATALKSMADVRQAKETIMILIGTTRTIPLSPDKRDLLRSLHGRIISVQNTVAHLSSTLHEAKGPCSATGLNVEDLKWEIAQLVATIKSLLVL